MAGLTRLAQFSHLSLESVLAHLDVSLPAADALTLFSGGAEGVDTVFDSLMSEYAPGGHCIHWSFEGHRDFAARVSGRIIVPDDVASGIADPLLMAAAKQLKQSMPKNPFVKALFRRNAFQVLWADAVYAISWEDEQAKYPTGIGGGTKWAVQVYINRFEPFGPEPAETCQLFFYDVKSATWRFWCPARHTWQSMTTAPRLCAAARFAGIGTRTPPDHAIKAARALFRNLMPRDDVVLSSSRARMHESHEAGDLFSTRGAPSSKRRWRRRQDQVAEPATD
mmetsp:Transcript_58809/g.164207  ORF Transcript_58809/g.164207 Transcript_58809/m.164207 type:complete len:280 (-) Transcript_58809:123-962(-)|eukprot:CAMPEP_0117514584 /NCGR_PEP_ID=MMETSP0784-20121206/30144_1 /TAXON_ID=39447 /ORGANISM="" /LENGTH=279 /DNA_ID=CAMNT_0005310383 /DNA_START=69 /DNA_END=908 /DNA_ORIENTATION=+